MQAGEVLMAELDDLHDARDHLTHRLARARLARRCHLSGCCAVVLPQPPRCEQELIAACLRRKLAFAT